MEQSSGDSLQFPCHLLPPTCLYSAPIFFLSLPHPLFLAFALTQPPLFLTPRPDTPLLLFLLVMHHFLDDTLLLSLSFHLFHRTWASTLPFAYALLSSVLKMTVSLRPRQVNVAALHLPSSQITLTFHTRRGHCHLIQHAQVQGCPCQPKMDQCTGPSSGSRAEISLHQSQTISPN